MYGSPGRFVEESVEEYGQNKTLCRRQFLFQISYTILMHACASVNVVMCVRPFVNVVNGTELREPHGL